MVRPYTLFVTTSIVFPGLFVNSKVWQAGPALYMEINFPNEGFPRKGQILPAPGRNVTEGDKEGNSCHRR